MNFDTIQHMEQIIGQELALHTLQTSLDNQRLHHAYIFHGPNGVGKYTTAIAFAKELLCHTPQQDLIGKKRSCSTCDSCKRFDQPIENDGVTSHKHEDIHVISKELALLSSNTTLRNRKLMNIPVDLIREYIVGGQTSDGKFHQSSAYKKPLLGHGKVFIIDESHLLDASGQNALLKTLEEPPENTYLFLITHSDDRLLVTIRSRCQRIGFCPINNNEIAKFYQEQYPQYDERQLDWMLRFAQGSLGQAKLIAEYDLYSWAKIVLPSLIQMNNGKFPFTLGSQMAEFVDGFAKSWVDRHKNASKDAANKMAAGLMWAMIGNFAQERLAKSTEQNNPNVQPWLGLIKAVESGHKTISSSVNMTLTMDHFVNLAYQSLEPSKA